MEKDSHFSEKLNIKYINLLGSSKYVHDNGAKDELVRFYDSVADYIKSVADGKEMATTDELIDIREAISKRKEVALSNQIQI